MAVPTGLKGIASAPPPFLSDAVVREAVSIIRQGGVVAIPTETYYGLAVDPFNEDAVTRLFSLKKRPLAKPLLTLIGNRSHLAMLTTEIPLAYLRLMDLWPGPLTLVFQAHPLLSPLVTGKTGTVGARISSHPHANLLVARIDQPVTATSANIAGQPAAVTASEVYRAFGSRIDYVVDGGRTPGGKGSTLVGLAAGKLVLIREGVIDFEKINVMGLEVGGEKTGS